MAATKHNIGGFVVNFPCDPYPVQVEFMRQVLNCITRRQNGLLESPTGTGKTLSLLCATIAWQETLTSKGSDRPKIIYCTRTHSQLKHVIAEMKRLNSYTPMAVIGSRDHLCTNDRFRKDFSVKPPVDRSGASLNNLCNKFASKSCKQFFGFQQNQKIPPTAADIEDLVEYGKATEQCPYYVSKELLKRANIVFMPYNYIVDPVLAKEYQHLLKNAVVLFDEAHNLDSVCEDALSFSFKVTEIVEASREIVGTLKELENNPDLGDVENLDRMGSARGTKKDQQADVHSNNNNSNNNNNKDSKEPAKVKTKLTKEDLVLLKAVLDRLAVLVDEAEMRTYPGEYIYDLLSKAKLTVDTFSVLHETTEKAITVMLEKNKMPGCNKLVGIINCLFATIPNIGKTAAAITNRTQHYKLHIQADDDRSSSGFSSYNSNNGGKKVVRVLNYWCMKAAVAMQALVASGPTCVIMASGTLSPLSSFAAEFDIPFPIQLENPHVVEADQVWVGVLKNGPSGGSINGSFTNRDTAGYKTDIGTTILHLCRGVPNGVLVFFTSYSLMESYINYWKAATAAAATSLWDQINRAKQIFVEPKGTPLFRFFPSLLLLFFSLMCKQRIVSNMLPQRMEEYYAKASISEGFGACRIPGKPSLWLGSANDSISKWVLAN